MTPPGDTAAPDGLPSPAWLRTRTQAPGEGPSWDGTVGPARSQTLPPSEHITGRVATGRHGNGQQADTARIGAARTTPPPARTDEALCLLVYGFARAFLEVEAGRRPRRQLTPIMSPELATRLAAVWVRQGQPPGRVLRVRGSRVTRDRYEAAALVARGDRAGVLAVALLHRAGAWRVVEAARPEDPYPLPCAPPASPAGVRPG